MLNPAAEAGDVQVNVPEADSDSEYETVPKKVKNTTQTGPMPVKESPSGQDTVQVDSAAEGQSIANESADADNAPQDTAMTDADWLRSRTSRLLGLAEEEEDATSKVVDDGSDTEEIIMEQKASQQDNTASAPDGQTLEVEEPCVDEAEEKIRTSLRLYLRNLSYKVLEDDLRTSFASFGNLEEVRLIFPFPCPPPFS